VIGAVLVPGGAAPKLISAKIIAAMKRGAVLVDVSIDQGSCSETSHPTTHSQPTYVVDGVVHYCVANMPGAVPRTTTFALNDATRPFVLALADKGISRAMQEDAGIRNERAQRKIDLSSGRGCAWSILCGTCRRNLARRFKG
jgi:alanine dehydrogenase